jgi:mannan endo-1,4-beta-mannosidase
MKILRILLNLLFPVLVSAEVSKESEFSGNIISRKGDKLIDGDNEFHFWGLATPNSKQNETQIRADRANRFPEEYEIRDVFSGIRGGDEKSSLLEVKR